MAIKAPFNYSEMVNHHINVVYYTQFSTDLLRTISSNYCWYYPEKPVEYLIIQLLIELEQIRQYNTFKIIQECGSMWYNILSVKMVFKFGGCFPRKVSGTSTVYIRCQLFRRGEQIPEIRFAEFHFFLICLKSHINYGLCNSQDFTSTNDICMFFTRLFKAFVHHRK